MRPHCRSFVKINCYYNIILNHVRLLIYNSLLGKLTNSIKEILRKSNTQPVTPLPIKPYTVRKNPVCCILDLKTNYMS